MKKEGVIPSNFKFSNPEILFQQPNKKINTETRAKKASGCGCYVTPDATYTSALGPSDDGSTGALAIPFTFCLYGTNYTSLYINNNGNVSFGSPYTTFSSNPFPDPGFVMVAPFWGDVDTRGAGTVTYKITTTAIYVNWEGVGYFNSKTDKLNTFQLIITDGSNPVLPAGNNIAFCYGDMQWTTGAASGGVGGFGGTPSTVGVNKGDGTSYIQLGRFDQAGSAYDGGGGLNDGISWLDNQSLYFNVCSGTNIAPIANFTPSVFNGAGGGACDTLKMCGVNDTLIINSLFLSPEIGETTTVTVNLGAIPGFTVLSNTPGNPANTSVQVIASPANAGMNTITFSATDDGAPSQTTIVYINIFVDTSGLSAFNPSIAGLLELCTGGSTSLTVSPTNLTSYIWNTGSIDTSISVNTGGEYWVTSELNGCYKTSNVEVIEHQPRPVILGPLFNCTGTPSTLYVDSAELYTSYSWSSSSTNDSISASTGNYTVTVTDSFGCSGTSPSVTVSSSTPTVSVSGSLTFCENDSSILTAVPSLPSGANYIWSSGDTLISTIIDSSGSVWVTVNYNNGCNASDTIMLTSKPIAFGSVTDTICQGSNYTLPGGSIVSLTGTYLDTLSSFISCDSIITTNLTAMPLADATISIPSSFCKNSSATNLITATSGGNWSGTGISNALTGEFTPSLAGVGLFEIIYTISTACGGADTAYIAVNSLPDFSLASIEDTCLASKGSILSVITAGLSPYTYSWDRGDNSQNLLSALAGTHSLAITDANNCSRARSAILENMSDDCQLIFPNVITPNGDGSNDVLFFKGLQHYHGSILTVYNRWGNKVYESSDYKNDWVPTNISDGTYFFVLKPGGLIETDIIKNTVTIFN